MESQQTPAASPPGQNGQAGTPRPTIKRKPEPGKRLMGKELVDAVAGILDGSPAGREEEPEGEAGEGAGKARLPGDGHDGLPNEREQDGHQGEDEPGEGESFGIDGKHGESTSLEEVAQALGVSVKSLNDVQIRVADKDGQPQYATLGELKGGFVKLAKFDQERAEFDDRVTATELEQIDAHRRIMALIDAFPNGSLPPAVLQRVNQQHEVYRREQAALLTKARPQWNDPKYVATERDGMMAVAKRYGFSIAELGAIVDHRQVLLLQDFAHALAKIDAAKGAARRVEPVGDKPLTQQTSRAVSGNTRSGLAGQQSKKSQLARRVAELIAKG